MSKRRGRGEGSIFKHSSGSWCAIISAGFDNQGKRTRKWVYGRTKKDVQEKLMQLHREQIKGTLLRTNNETVQSYFEQWLDKTAKPTLRPSTYSRYGALLRTHLYPHLGSLRLKKLAPYHMQALYTKMGEEGLSGRTQQFLHAVVRRGLRQAVLWDLLPRNICDAVTRPKAERKQMQVWDEQEVEQFLKTAETDKHYGLYVLALTTGMRQGELLGLKWQDVDLKAGFLSIQRTLQEIEGKLVVGPPKSKAARRKIVLPDVAVETLKAHRKRQLTRKLAASKWVFPNKFGEPLKPREISLRSFPKLTQQAGLNRIRFHDLRHTAATLLLLAGENPKVVQERLGHSSISLTIDTYSHVLPSMQKDAARKIDVLFSNFDLLAVNRLYTAKD